MSTQGFYKWLAAPVSQRDWDDAHLVNAIVDVHADHSEFGYRFITDELKAAGHACSENRVQRLCALQQIASSTRRRRGSGKRPGLPVHDDHVNRVCHAETLDAIWLTDISEHNHRQPKSGQTRDLRRGLGCCFSLSCPATGGGPRQVTR